MIETAAQSERRRIRAEYERRDCDASLQRRFTLTEPAFLFHMQDREWTILRHLGQCGVGLDGRRVLEIGCGDAHILHRFVDFGASEAVGVDLMQGRIESAHRRFPSVMSIVADGADLPLSDASFDLVTQFMCISSVLSAEVRQSIGREMWRVLRPGGVIVSYDMRRTPLGPRVFWSIARLFAAVRRPLRLRRRVSKSEGDFQVTPVVPLEPAEIRRLFPGICRLRSVSLDPNLSCLARYGRWFPLLLGIFPFLRTHYIAIIHKPGPAAGDRLPG